MDEVRVGSRVKLADKSEVPTGTGRVITAYGCVLALFNIEGTFHAIENSCPHRGGPLGEGVVQGHLVICPWHGWEFDVKTGRCPRIPSARVRSIPLEIEGEEIYAIFE